MPTLAALRAEYHRSMHTTLFGMRVREGNPVIRDVGDLSFTVVTCADADNPTSVVLSAGVAARLGIPMTPIGSKGSTLGNLFEVATRGFVTQAVALFDHLHSRHLVVRPGSVISDYAQFAHLGEIQRLVEGNPELQAALGGDYLVDPDILVMFDPLSDADLNAGGAGLGPDMAARTTVRAENSPLPILHASISCKWTMRRDRAQNTRLEALNLVRNRKGRLPHVAAVTMECDPEILASLCLGTGDIDCVYHAALHELVDAAVHAADTMPAPRRGATWPAKLESLRRMVDGSRLRDISDLPLDLIV